MKNYSLDSRHDSCKKKLDSFFIFSNTHLRLSKLLSVYLLPLLLFFYVVALYHFHLFSTHSIEYQFCMLLPPTCIPRNLFRVMAILTNSPYHPLISPWSLMLFELIIREDSWGSSSSFCMHGVYFKFLACIIEILLVYIPYFIYHEVVDVHTKLECAQNYFYARAQYLPQNFGCK